MNGVENGWPQVHYLTAALQSPPKFLPSPREGLHAPGQCGQSPGVFVFVDMVEVPRPVAVSYSSRQVNRRASPTVPVRGPGSGKTYYRDPIAATPIKQASAIRFQHFARLVSGDAVSQAVCRKTTRQSIGQCRLAVLIQQGLSLALCVYRGQEIDAGRCLREERSVSFMTDFGKRAG